MFVPFKIKKSTIDATYLLRRCDFDTRSMISEVKSRINVNRIKEALINGTQLQEEWFPSEFYDSCFDVFISHAHADDSAVRQLAGYLQEKYGLRCFIDSVYWGYVGDLQKSLDDWYSKCVTNGFEYYDYETSNFMASNVHIMLSMALLKMMDACECLIFVDSDNSLKYQSGQPQTPSPWIYEEMGFAKRLRVNIPDRYKNNIRVSINESRDSSFIGLVCFSAIQPHQANFRYNINLRDFKELDLQDFCISRKQRKDVLDEWYRKYGVYDSIAQRLIE